MAQHFLLSPAARNLTLQTIMRFSEADAYKVCCGVKWGGTNGRPVCQKCELPTDAVYVYKIRSEFKCQVCGDRFSLRTNSYISNSKIGYDKLIAAVYLFVNKPTGYAALRLCNDLGLNYRTAFYLLHKFRRVLVDEAERLIFHGRVEIDGIYVGKYVRPANRKHKRVDTRFAQHQSKNKRVIVGIRQRGGRTYTRVFLREGEAYEMIREKVSVGSTIYVDAATDWKKLKLDYKLRVVDHSKEYATWCNIVKEWFNTNIIESFHSRVRRAEVGVYHHIAPRHTLNYARELAWREDFRRATPHDRFLMFLRMLLNQPPTPVPRRVKAIRRKSPIQ